MTGKTLDTPAGPEAPENPWWEEAWCTYRRKTLTWEAQGGRGDRPRLELPIDRPRPVWAGHQAAYTAYRAAMGRVEAHLGLQDVFERPSMKRPDIRAADRAIQAAFRAQDGPGVARALARWELAITGRAG